MSSTVPTGNRYHTVSLPVNGFVPVPVSLYRYDTVPVNCSVPVPVNCSVPVPVNCSVPVPVNGSTPVPVRRFYIAWTRSPQRLRRPPTGRSLRFSEGVTPKDDNVPKRPKKTPDLSGDRNGKKYAPWPKTHLGTGRLRVQFRSHTNIFCLETIRLG